jgi:hypothetical protein
MNPETDSPVGADKIQAAHRLYCELTGQSLRLAFDRERAWYEILRAGYELRDIRRVIRYLQREIQRERRNVGALKLRNLLQPDQFEEDLNISRVRLEAIPARRSSEQSTLPEPACDMEQDGMRRQKIVEELARFRASL